MHCILQYLPLEKYPSVTLAVRRCFHLRLSQVDRALCLRILFSMTRWDFCIEQLSNPHSDTCTNVWVHIYEIDWSWNAKGVHQEMGLRVCFPQYYIIKRQTEFSMRHTLNELQTEDTKRSRHRHEETKCSKLSWQVEAIHHKWHITTWASVLWNSCYFSATNGNVPHAFLFSASFLHCPLTRDVGSPLTHCSARAVPSAAAGIPTLQPPNAKISMQPPKSAGDSVLHSCHKQTEA